MRTLRDLPGPAQVPGLGNTVELLVEQPHVALAEYAREHGDFVVWWRFGTPKGLVNDPALVRRILVDDKDDWIKDSPVDELRPVVRSSVFIANPPEWSGKRREHPFEQDLLTAWKTESLPTVRERFRSVFRAASKAGQVELFETVHRACFDLLADLVVGERLTDQDWDDYNVMLAEGARRIKVGPISVAPHFDQARARWWDRITAIVRHRTAHPAPAAGDVLSRLLRAATSLQGDRLVDEIGTIFLAGAGPIATTVTVAAWNLARHPKHATALRKSLQGFEVEVGPDWDWATLDAFSPLARFLDESMRVIPTVPVISRVVRPGATATLRDVRLEAGDEVFVCQWALHNTPGLWPDPDRFDPSRFERAADPFTFMPFGAGERRCVGKPVALYFAKAAVAALAGRWRARIDTSRPFPSKLYTGFMIPSRRIQATLVRP